MSDAVGDVWLFDRPEGELRIEIVEVGAKSIRWCTSWTPATVAPPRLCDPAPLKSWRHWRKRGRPLAGR